MSHPKHAFEDIPSRKSTNISMRWSQRQMQSVFVKIPMLTLTDSSTLEELNRSQERYQERSSRPKRATPTP